MRDVPRPFIGQLLFEKALGLEGNETAGFGENDVG